MRGIFLLSVLGLVSVTEAGLSLDLYYESLCPDSTRFISQQIGPMHEALGQDVTINFVPYGFASVGIVLKLEESIDPRRIIRSSQLPLILILTGYGTSIYNCRTKSVPSPAKTQPKHHFLCLL